MKKIYPVLFLSLLSIAAAIIVIARRSPAQHARSAQVVHQVRLTDGQRYAPAALRIKMGDAVEWENRSQFMHTVTADPAKATDARNVQLPPGAAAFDSGTLEPGKKFRHTFVVPGIYRYISIPYEAAGMRGEIEVQPVSD